MWDPPGPGLEPMSPALAGGFLTTAPPGKPPSTGFLKSGPISGAGLVQRPVGPQPHGCPPSSNSCLRELQAKAEPRPGPAPLPSSSSSSSAGCPTHHHGVHTHPPRPALAKHWQREARENQTGRPHQEFGEERVTWESLGLPEAGKP